jgi:hypothetical protein
VIGVAVISDRADLYLPGCLDSLDEHLPDVPLTVIDDRDHRLGMSGAVNAAWDWARLYHFDHLFHVEEDFRFHEAPVRAMVEVLDHDETLAQVVLKRQPWSPEEQRAGGIIESHPYDYTDHQAGTLQWTSHQRIFSLNPCVIPRRVLEMGWPAGNEAEMTANLVAGGFRFAFYGHRNDPPRVEHVGAVRGSGWRL